MKWKASYLCASSLFVLLKPSDATSIKDFSHDSAKENAASLDIKHSLKNAPLDMREGVAAFDANSIYNQLGPSDSLHFVMQATDNKVPKHLETKKLIDVNAHSYSPTRHDLSPIRDPCTIASKMEGPMSYNVVKACLDADFAFPGNHRNDTAETIKSLLSSFYVFEDMAANPPINNDAPGLSFLPTELISKIDQLIKQISDEEDTKLESMNPGTNNDGTTKSSIQGTTESSNRGTTNLSHREFHDRLSQILAQARDGHLSYDADCFRAFRFQHGFFMNHVVRDGQTVLKVHSVAPYFRTVNDVHEDILGCDIVSIEGRDASDYIQEWADNHVSMSKDANIRFNAALSTPQYRSGIPDFFIPGKFSERFMLPEEASLEFSFRCPGRPSESLLELQVKWVGYYTHDITRPYEDTQSYFEANCMKSNDDSSYSQVGQNKLELIGNLEQKKIAKLRSTLKDLLREPDPQRNIVSDSVPVNPLDLENDTPDSKSKVDDIMNKWDLLSPQQLPVLKYYDDQGGRPGELSMTANKVLFEEVYRGEHGISALLLNDGKTGVITVRTESSTIRSQTYSELHPIWIGSLIQAINVLRPQATNLILDLSHNTGGYVCLAITMIQIFFPDRPRLVTNIKISPLGMHLMSSGAMGLDHFISSYGRSTKAAPYQKGFFSRNVTHPERNQTFTDYLSDRCVVADHYTLKVDPDEERKRGRNASSESSQVYYPWDPNNIAILTDGYCGSSCALITNLMHKRFGVRTVVIGGKSPISEPMGYSTFPGLQVIDDEFIFSEIQSVRSDEIRSEEELKVRSYTKKVSARLITTSIPTRPHLRRGDSRRSRVIAEKKMRVSDEVDNEEEDGDNETDQEVDTSKFLYPLEFSHKGRLRLTWRQIYNTGSESNLFVYTESKSYQPNWNVENQWDEYSFIPATMRIEYTDHNVHSMGAIWKDVRDTVWGTELEL